MITKPLGLAVASAAAMLATSVLARYLQSTDVVSPETGKRLVQVGFGLWLAVWGNYMPKGWGAPAAPACAPSRVRSAIRVGGWAMTLAGLVHAAAWAFAPMSVARPMAVVAVATAAVLTVAYWAWAVAACGSRTARRAPTPF